MNIVKVKFYNKLVGAYSQEYLCEDGAVINDELNETLDSASIVIKNQTSVLDIQPFDKVQLNIYDDSELIFSHYFLVNSWQRAITRQVNAKTYNYSISLISETKELEGIPLPNLVITNDSGLSVLDYIKRYNSLYGHYNIIDANFIGFDDVVCPNMRWNTPTLREVLNDLCLVKDCLIVLVNGNLKAVNISIKGSEFTSEYITYENVSQSLEDYTSEVRCNLGNAVDEDTSKRTNDIGFKNNEVAYFNTATTDNAGSVKIETSNPIMVINKFYATVGVKSSNSASYRKVRFDMTNFVKEIGVYNSLNSGRDRDLDDFTNYYKSNCVYYVRGSNSIDGFTTNDTEAFFGRIKTSTIESWVYYFERQLGFSSVGGVVGEGWQTFENYNNWRFEIEYTSISNQSFQLSRGTNYQKIRNPRVIFDNQDNSGVDVNRYVKFEKNKLERLSNEVGLIQQQNVPSLDDIAQLRQTYMGSVIYSRSMRIGRKCFNCEYYATKNYVLANYFTQMNSQKRNFEWIDEAQAVKRQEFKKIYYELGFNQPANVFDINYLTSNPNINDLVDVQNENLNNILYALSPFADCRKYCHFYRDDVRNVKIETKGIGQSYIYNQMILVDSNLQCIKNIVSYNFQLDSNVFAGYKSVWHTSDGISGSKKYPVAGFYNEGINYNANSSNTFTDLLVKFGGHTYQDELICKNVQFGNNYDKIKLTSEEYPYNNYSQNTTGRQQKEGLCLTYSIPIYKDNAEKLGLSMNFEWVSDNDDIEVLDLADNSLFATNRSSEYLIGKHYSSLYDVQYNPITPPEERPVPNPITTTLRVELMDGNNTTTYNNQGLYKYGNNYYSDKTHLNQITHINDSDVTRLVMFVYNLDDNKLYMEDVSSIYNGTSYSFKAHTSIELKNDDFVFYDDNSYRVLVFNQDKVTLNKVDSLEIYNNLSLPLKNAVGYKNGVATNLSGLMNITGNIEINVNDTYDYIIVNDSIKINNVSAHTINNKVVVYLKIKDYFI